MRSSIGVSGVEAEPHRLVTELDAEVAERTGQAEATQADADRRLELIEPRRPPHSRRRLTHLTVHLDLEPAHEREDVGDLAVHEIEIVEAAGLEAAQPMLTA